MGLNKHALIGGLIGMMLAIALLICLYNVDPTSAPQPLPDYPVGIDSSKLQTIEAYYLNQIDSLNKVINIHKLPTTHEKTDYTKLPSNALLDSLHKYYCTADTLH